MADGYEVRLAEQQHVALLPEVERAAARLFDGMGLPESLLAETTDIADFEEARREELLWVALAPGGDEAVGFALVEASGEGLHLEELDVHPEHGRRGLGRRLLEAVRDGAGARGAVAVTLTTFRDVPWNAPFYAAFGFEPLDPAGLPEELAERMRDEAQRGLDPDRRVAMRLRV